MYWSISNSGQVGCVIIQDILVQVDVIKSADCIGFLLTSCLRKVGVALRVVGGVVSKLSELLTFLVDWFGLLASFRRTRHTNMRRHGLVLLDVEIRARMPPKATRGWSTRLVTVAYIDATVAIGGKQTTPTHQSGWQYGGDHVWAGQGCWQRGRWRFGLCELRRWWWWWLSAITAARCAWETSSISNTPVL